MRKLKLLHAADLHLDSGFEALSPEAAKTRRQGQRQLIFKMAELAEKLGVDAVLLCGDIFNSFEVSKETMSDFSRALGALPCPVLIAPGNHDPYTAHSMWEMTGLPENMFIFKKEKIECIQLPGVEARFWGAGFQNTFCKPLLRDFEAPEKHSDLPDIMLIHGDVGNGESAYNAISREDILKSGMDYIALGHIHTATALKTSGETCYAYSGCTEGRGFDETGEKGVLFVTVTEEGVKSDFLPLGGVRYEIFHVDISEGEPVKKIMKAAEGMKSTDCCRIILTGESTPPPDMAMLRRSLEGRFAEVSLRDETVPKRDIWAQTGQDTLAGVFLEKLRSLYEGAKDDRERQIVEMAVRYGLSAMEDGGQPL